MMGPAIDVRNYSKHFGGKAIHHNVTFTVQRGECLGLIGGSGVGKSVILRSLIGLERPDSGQIFIDQDEISTWNDDQLIDIRKKVAYVFQNGALFDSMSVFDNLAYPLRAHSTLSEPEIADRIHEQLAEFGLENNAKLFPSELSGGMQKRVGLARAIIMRPQVVLYDEPTAGLDPYNTIRIQEMVLRLKAKGVSSMFVTHDMPTAFAVCDRMCLLLGGEVKAIGSIEDMKRDPNGVLHRFISGEEV